jgi:hypothetical protein
LNATGDDVINAIADVLRLQYDVNPAGEYTFALDEEHPLLPISITEVSALAESINSYDEGDDGSVTTRNSFEVLVQSNRAVGLGPAFREEITLDDPHSGLSYKFGYPSDAFAAYLCLKLLELTNAGDRGQFRSRLHAPGRYRLMRAEDPRSVLDVLKFVLRSRSLRITSSSTRPKGSWKDPSDAFFFHLGYNLDVALMPDRNFSELVRPVKISSMRRSRGPELDAPRRSYISDLVYHYQLGVAAESPMLEYISYYHVAEHWFENIYQDDLVEQIQLAITSPSFSYKRKKDLRQLIQSISRAVQLRDDRLVINEQVALRLTLAKYLDVPQLASDLRSYDTELLAYYAGSKVSFCSGDVVEFGHADTAAIIAALAKRIYKTRNALVHSKDGERSRFVPFRDDGDLLPEVPLMRFVAEQIITATSSIPS